MKITIKNFFSHILAGGATPYERAAAVALGVFIAFSPFLGVQTFLIFGGAWLLGLNASITFAVVYLINNPWTMIPIAAADYLVGLYVVERWLGYDLMPYNPAFMDWVNNKIGYYIMNYLGIPALCFWYYIIGGLILALCVSLLAYPLFRYIFVNYQRHHENNNSK